MTQPTLFVGSSGEAHSLAVTLVSLLDRHLSVRVWSHGTFAQNRGNLENLLHAAGEHDFACFVASPDDFSESRGSRRAAPRDNVVFEFGLFLGALGRDRVFFLYPRGVDLKLPTDLDGVTFIDYKTPDGENPPKAGLAPAAEELLSAAKKHGRRPQAQARRYRPVLERGGIDRVAGITDAALYYSRKRFGYHQEMKQYLLQREPVPARYYYSTDEGAQFWLQMSADPKYRFQGNSMRLVRKVAKRFARRIQSVQARADLDFVSLGSGDGEKDRMLIEAFIAEGSKSLYYYPIDISDKLLVECVKNVASAAYDHRGLRTKAIIGDFCDLEVLRAVYEDRPSPNIFVVLGNTLGNTDEGEVLSALRRALFPGDFLILEVNCGVGDVASSSSFITSPLVLDYTCLPLRILGLNPNPSAVVVRETTSSVSAFRCARSFESVYPTIELDGRAVENAPLAFDHRYEFDAFGEEVAALLEVEVLDREKVGNACAFLLRKL